MKKLWSIIFTLAIFIGLFFILREINFYEVYLLVSSANGYWFSLAVGVTFLTFIVWNIRWHYILRPLFKGNFWFVFKVLLAGSFFNTVTPGGGVGGEPFRAYFLSKKYKVSKVKILGYTLADKFFQNITLVFFIFVSVLFVLFYLNISHSLRLILEILLIVVLIASGFVIFLIFRKMKTDFSVFFRKLYWFKFVKKRFKTIGSFMKFVNKSIESFSADFRAVIKNKKNVYLGFIYSFIYWILYFAISYFLFLSFGYPVNPLSVAIVVTLSTLIGSLSILPGGIGVTETSMILLFSAMGIPSYLALLVSFLSRIIYYFFAIILGGWSFINVRKETNGKSGFF